MSQTKSEFPSNTATSSPQVNSSQDKNLMRLATMCEPSSDLAYSGKGPSFNIQIKAVRPLNSGIWNSMDLEKSQAGLSGSLITSDHKENERLPTNGNYNLFYPKNNLDGSCTDSAEHSSSSSSSSSFGEFIQEYDLNEPPTKMAHTESFEEEGLNFYDDFGIVAPRKAAVKETSIDLEVPEAAKAWVSSHSSSHLSNVNPAHQPYLGYIEGCLRDPIKHKEIEEQNVSFKTESSEGSSLGTRNPSFWPDDSFSFVSSAAYSRSKLKRATTESLYQKTSREQLKIKQEAISLLSLMSLQKSLLFPSSLTDLARRSLKLELKQAVSLQKSYTRPLGRSKSQEPARAGDFSQVY